MGLGAGPLLVSLAGRLKEARAIACGRAPTGEQGFGATLRHEASCSGKAAATAEEVAKLFVECIAAPGFDDRAKEIFSAKKNLRLLELPPGGLEPERELQLKRILGGMLVQQPDLGNPKRRTREKTLEVRFWPL